MRLFEPLSEGFPNAGKIRPGALIIIRSLAASLSHEPASCGGAQRFTRSATSARRPGSPEPWRPRRQRHAAPCHEAIGHSPSASATARRPIPRPRCKATSTLGTTARPRPASTRSTAVSTCCTSYCQLGQRAAATASSMIVRMAVFVPTRMSGVLQQLFPGHRALVREWVILRGRPARSGLRDRLDVEVPSVGLDDAEPELDLARSTSSAIAADGVSKIRTSTSGWVLNLLRIGGRWWTAKTGRHAISRRSRRLAPCCLSSSNECSSSGDGLLRLRQEFDAGTRQRHLAGGARDQLDAELVLELAHAMADRGLRQVEMRGRLSEAAALRDAQKGLQAEEVDSHR